MLNDKYVCVQDLQFPHDLCGFAVGCKGTIEQWRRKAMMWAEYDGNDGIVDCLKDLNPLEVIDYIKEFWSLEIKPINKLTEEEEEFLKGEITDLVLNLE